MMDFTKPQPFNVSMGDAEIADERPRHFVEAPPIPYQILMTNGVEPEPDVYGVSG